MAEEIAEVKTEEQVINEYLASQTYIDKLNAEKGKWGESYKTDKLPSILEEARKSERDKTILELNPEETAADKRIRAIEEELKTSKDKLALNVLQEALRTKAKEIGFDTTRADRYSAYGDAAEETMIADHEYMTNLITSEIDKKIKGSYDTQQPKQSDKQTGKILTNDTKGKSVNEIRALIRSGQIEGL